jgi:hypothetical protein
MSSTLRAQAGPFIFGPPWRLAARSTAHFTTTSPTSSAIISNSLEPLLRA